MKITDIKTFNVFTYRTNFVFVKLETDEGISGIGEGTLEYKENALLGAIEDIKRVLIGQDPREVERISHELYRDSYWRVGPVLQSAVSAVNMAMWDIKAKAAGVPESLMMMGAISRLEPPPKFLSATIISSVLTPFTKSGRASSSTCFAYSAGFPRRDIRRPGAIESVLTLEPNFHALPCIESLIIV